MDEEDKPTNEDRRKRAIKEGKRFESVVCPLCLKARVGKVLKGDYIFKPDPNPEVIQVRYGIGGRGCGGFFKNTKESIRMDILREKKPEVWKSLKFSVDTISKMFKEE